MRRVSVSIVLGLALGAGLATASSSEHGEVEENPMEVRGEFEISMKPAEPGDETFGDLILDKKYHGALTAVSRGRMLAFRTETEGSAGYTAMEQVSGTLDGRKGSFVLLHHGLMKAGTPVEWGVTVVPDSGTEELAGLSGEMQIFPVDGRHEYVLRYTTEP